MKSGETALKEYAYQHILSVWYRCLKCGCEEITEKANYCPNCGRKIVPKEKS